MSSESYTQDKKYNGGKIIRLKTKLERVGRTQSQYIFFASRGRQTQNAKKADALGGKCRP